ncbi:MAG: FHA domain-containing protein [Proteobacteria bacterium]|nr:FHA domain-containing protein [Pseudomonadota bacterium]
MRGCPSCGVENRSDFRFCRACGRALGQSGSAADQAAGASAALAGEALDDTAIDRRCGQCGALNAPTMRFCTQCGTGLPAAAAPAQVAAFSAASSRSGDADAPAPAASPPLVRGPAVSEFEASQRTERDVEAVPLAPLKAAAGEAAGEAAVEAAVEAAKQSGEAERSLASAARPSASAIELARDVASPGVSSALPPTQAVGAVAAVSGTGDYPQPGLRPAVAARLVTVRRDGSDGAAYEIDEVSFDIGRTAGRMSFPDDPYLAERHGRFLSRGGAWLVQCLQPAGNGIYLRVREPETLQDGDRILVGRQVFRFDRVAESERNLGPALQDGVLLFGSPINHPWARLRQLSVAGVYRDCHYLHRPRVAIGREGPDICFPDDEFMSRRHVAIAFDGQRAELHDLGSSNGTYLRLRGEAALRSGDQLRLGDQLFRFELL